VSPDTRFREAVQDYMASDEDKTWYARAIGSLMYAMLGTRPDIASSETTKEPLHSQRIHNIMEVQNT
jgi:hypothetical protein